MWQFCLVCRRAPLFCITITLTASVFVLSHLRCRCFAPKIMKNNFSLNELVHCGVFNLVQVLFLKIYIVNHIHPTVTDTEETKLEGYCSATLPTPSLNSSPPSVAKSDLVFAGGWAWAVEWKHRKVCNLKRHRDWVSKERNQLNLQYSCHGRVVSCLYPEFDSSENDGEINPGFMILQCEGGGPSSAFQLEVSKSWKLFLLYSVL